MQLELIPHKGERCLHCKTRRATEGWGPAFCIDCHAWLQTVSLDELSASMGYRRCAVRSNELTQAGTCCGQPTTSITTGEK